MDRKIVRGKARRLRAKGKTYAEINSTLKTNIPKGTLSGWCKGVKLPEWYRGRIEELNKRNFSNAQKASIAARRFKRKKLLEDIDLKNKSLLPFLENKEVLKAILAMLYLGEGSKWKSHRGLMLGSSDPDIIRLYIKLLSACYGKEAREMKCRISYRADQNIKHLEKYWSEITNIPLVNFYKTKPDPRTIGRPTRNIEYKGVCVIMSAGTEIQLELESIAKLTLRNIQ